MNEDKNKTVNVPEGNNKESSSRKFFSKVSQRGNGSSVLGIIIGILFITAFMSMLTGGQPKTFASFLEAIRNCPQIDISFLFDWIVVPRITADWEALNFVRNFINSWLDLAGGLWSFLLFLSSGILNFVALLLWLLPWFFL